MTKKSTSRADGYNVLDENIDSHPMLIVFLVDRQCFLVKTMIGGNFGNLSGIVILQLVDVSNNLALLGPNSCQKEEVLQVLIVAEG